MLPMNYELCYSYPEFDTPDNLLFTWGRVLTPINVWGSREKQINSCILLKIKTPYL